MYGFVNIEGLPDPAVFFMGIQEHDTVPYSYKNGVGIKIILKNYWPFHSGHKITFYRFVISTHAYRSQSFCIPAPYRITVHNTHTPD